MLSDQIGKIFDIQRFALNDGPGIRTTIFMKGCSLACAWCHNPESWDVKSELGFKEDKCSLCKNCEDVCEYDVHSFENGKHLLDRSKCQLCGKCVEVCSENALKIYGEDYTTEDLYSLVQKDKVYYEESGGGITISGGEPLQQWQFVKEVFRLAKMDNIHTCLDTSGYADTSVIEKLISAVDLFLYDYKLSNEDDYSSYSKIDKEIVINNLRILNKNDKEVILRCPIVNEINDNEYHVNEIIQLANKYKNIKQIDLLTYHNYGENKYLELGRQKKFEIQNEINSKNLNMIREHFVKNLDIPVNISNNDYEVESN
ncbi:MAG: glycyl-radical enzyme activating protein [Bacteroidota bacterium]